MEFDVLRKKIYSFKKLNNLEGTTELESSLRVFYVYGRNRKSFLSGLLLNSLENISLNIGQVAWLLAEKGQIISYMYIFEHKDKFAIIASEKSIINIYEKLNFYSLVEEGIFLEWDNRFKKSFLNVSYTKEKSMVCTYLNNSYQFCFNNILIVFSPIIEEKSLIPVEYEEMIWNNNFLKLKMEQLFIPELAFGEILNIMISQKCFLGKAMNTRMHSRGHINRKVKIFELEGTELAESICDIINQYEIIFCAYNLYWDKVIFSLLFKGRLNLKNNVFNSYSMVKELKIKDFLICNTSLKS